MSSGKSTLHPACLAARGGENVHDGRGNVKLSEQFDFAPSNARVNVQFPRDCDEIFLEHLQRRNSRPRPAVLGYNFEGPPLFGRRGPVIRVCLLPSARVPESCCPPANTVNSWAQNFANSCNKGAHSAAVIPSEIGESPRQITRIGNGASPATNQDSRPTKHVRQEAPP